MIRLLLIFSLLLTLLSSFFSTRVEAYAKPVSKIYADLFIKVSALNGLEAGSKVLNNGLVVGKVSFVDSKRNGSAIVGVILQNTELTLGSIALIKSPMTVDPSNRQTLLEFFAPLVDSSKSVKKGSILKGFCSFEEFWKADLGKIGSSYETASIT